MDLDQRLAYLTDHIDVAGNAYSDADQMSRFYDLVSEALTGGRPDIAYEAYDIIGIEFMGEPPMADWAEFVALVTEVYHPTTGLLSNPR